MKLKYWFFYLLIALGLFLRLYRFGSLPLSLNRDEAALGYNAFALTSAGVDEWGVRYPLLFKSFGDYKLPGYIYALVPLVKLFGPSEAIIRLPSLLAGLILIWLTYRVARSAGARRDISLLAAALIAVSPWAIFYSRVAFEANLGLVLFILSGWLLSAKKLAQNLGGTVLFLLAIMTYNTPLLLTPILLGIIWLKPGKPSAKYLLLGLISFIAAGWFFTIGALTAQKSQITIFADPHTQFLQQTAYLEASNWFSQITASKYIYYPLLVVKNAANWFSPAFLVTDGGQNPWHSLPGRGHLYWAVYVLFIYQIFRLLSKRKYKLLALTFALLVIAILPSILTVDSPHATRSLLALWGLVLVAAHAWQEKKIRLIAGLVLGLEIGFFAYSYFVTFPVSHSKEWQVGLKEAIISAEATHPDGQIAILNPQAQPYIYTLLYLRVPPSQYRASVQTYGPDPAGLINIKSCDRWVFLGDPRDLPEPMPYISRDETGNYHLVNPGDDVKLNLSY